MQKGGKKRRERAFIGERIQDFTKQERSSKPQKVEGYGEKISDVKQNSYIYVVELDGNLS